LTEAGASLVVLEQGVELPAGDQLVGQQHLPDRHVGRGHRLKPQRGLELRRGDVLLVDQDLAESARARRLRAVRRGRGRVRGACVRRHDGPPARVVRWLRSPAEMADDLGLSAEVAHGALPHERQRHPACREGAAHCVAARSACIGVRPASTRYLSSNAFFGCPWPPASVPAAIGTPSSSARRMLARWCGWRSIARARTWGATLSRWYTYTVSVGT